MTVKDLLVHVDNTQWCKRRISDAVTIAEQNDAHLTGIYTRYTPVVSAYSEGGLAYIYDELEQQGIEQANHAKELFNKWTHSWRSKSSWVVEVGDPAGLVAKNAAHHDIVVVGQRDSNRDQSNPPAIVDRVAIESGRPVLVIPKTGTKNTVGSRILVAWNGKREAVRAVHDALPFLKGADAVEVVSINSKKESDIPCLDIVEHLSRHGVRVEGGNAETKSRHTGEAILYLAQNFAADLIVMGAYGHSRLREYVLGGATKHILEKTKVPILLSH